MKIARLVVASSLIAVASPAIAQDENLEALAPTATEEAAPAIAKPTRLDEIVVTAQKRAENIQDVPISVSVMTAERLKASNMENFEDVALATPNTEINMTSSYVQVGMRGLNAPINDGMEQSVGFYVDGIYYGKTAFLQDAFLDLERVELLKGPQGTLFGKNTIAGAVNVHSAKPAHEWLADGTIAGGEFNGAKAEAMVNIPVVDDTLAIRLAAITHKRDGFVENVVRGTDEKRVDKFGVRGKVLWEPTADLDFTLTLYAGQSKDNGQGWEPFLLQQDAQTIHGAFNPNLEANADYVGHANDNNFSHSRSLVGNLEANWDIGNHTLTFIGGVGQLDENFLLDGDTASAPIVNWANNDDYQQAMGELRLVSSPFETGFGEIDYIVGLFAFAADYHGASELRILPTAGPADTLLNVVLPGAVRETLLGALLPLTDPLDPVLNAVASDALFQTFDQVTQTYALFGQVTWRPLDDLAVIIGLRGSMESKKVELIQRYEETGLLLQAGFGVQQYTVDTTRDETNVAPKLTVKYDVGDDLMVYATYGEGFKAGGFNPIARTADESTFEQETSTAYELGAKLTALEGMATVNMALFHTKFDDMQIQSFIGNGFLVRNAAKATTQGVELEANWMPLEGTIVYGGGGYTDATFDSFPDGPRQASQQSPVPGQTCSQDLAGAQLPRAPKWNASAGFNAGIPLFNGGMAFIIGGDVIWRDKIYFDLDQDEFDTQAAFWQFNARLGVADTDGAWRFIVHGKNITDETVKVFSADLPVLNGSHMGFLAAPRMVTAEFAVSL